MGTIGFPEPSLSGSERFALRWAVSNRGRLIREEVTSLESISDLGCSARPGPQARPAARAYCATQAFSKAQRRAVHWCFTGA
jgi:hypothetical protein